jgi:hypothetical protein
MNQQIKDLKKDIAALEGKCSIVDILKSLFAR